MLFMERKLNKITNSDSLSMTYKIIGLDGKVKTMTNTLKTIASTALDDDIYQTALMVKDLLAYGTEKIARRTEILYVED